MQLFHYLLLLPSMFAPGFVTSPTAPPLGTVDATASHYGSGLLEVQLRVEGAKTTIFEGIVFSKGHNVTTASGGTHRCDGTNNGANPTPGNTPTATLDTAGKLAGFTFDGTFGAFDDFFITRIGPDAQTATQFWGVLVNYQFTPVGGCQFEDKTNDQILWAFDAFNVKYFLKLDGRALAKTGQAFNLTVTDGTTGVALAGAQVLASSGVSASTDTLGHAQFTFGKAGIYTFKASRTDSIRSNTFIVAVV